ncbi:unnamed protein product [Pleuronectes platessa]|uniref:Uncharacterized protein n=1 Tax=Pleuronectes platessa TaxID=8262 RepID=A0A9N7YLP5_PLEPL|nr:unnamed protein product [Pleuronectes platessa]
MFIFVVKPLGTCRGWGSSHSVAHLSAPPEAQVLIRWRLTASRGLSFSWTAGRCPSPVRKAGRWRGPGTRSAAVTLDACRNLLADHLSYATAGGTLCSRARAPCGAPRLAPSS